VAIPLLAVAAAVYARGWARLHRRQPRRFRWRHLLAFLGGLDALLVAVASPLGARAAESLPAHMAQHVLLMMVSPPLIWLGAPLAPVLRGLPEAVMRPVIASLAWSPIRRGSRVVTHPAVGWVSFTAVAWAWHAPALYELALSSHAWHLAEHLCFFAAGLLFWWPVVQPWPSRAHWPRWTVIPYLLLAELQNTLLAALFVFGGRALYPTYATIAARGGLSPLDEQVAAGLIMWGPGSLAMLLPAACVTLELLVPTRATPGVRAGQPPPLPPAL
jgi:cytochrome c oxidase assembly factor CtaG